MSIDLVELVEQVPQVVVDEETVTVTVMERPVSVAVPAVVQVEAVVGPATVTSVLAGVPGRSVNVRFAPAPPTGADQGNEGDLWVVTV